MALPTVFGVSERLPDWRVSGQQSDAAWGQGITGLGDIDGDGIDDFAASGHLYDQYGQVDSGRTAIFFGSSNGPTATPDWNGVQLDGTSGSHFGYSLAPAGDIDGDGRGDLLVGEPSFSNVETMEGRVTAILGAEISNTPAIPRSLEVNRLAPASGSVGQPIPYQIQVTNTGLVTASQILVTATLPANATYESGGTYAHGEISWIIPSLSAGGTSSQGFAVTTNQAISLTGGGYGVLMVTPVYTVSEGVGYATDVVPVTQITGSGGWNALTTNTPPDLWGESATVYDAASQSVWLYGRTGNSWPATTETWQFSGTSWQAISTTHTPTAIYGLNLEMVGGTAVLFGGYDSQDVALAETWTFDGLDWQQMTISSTIPARGSAASASDGSQMWLFGGQERLTYFADLWRYDGVAWSEVTTSNTPSARSNATLVYADGDLWLFGGRAPDGTILGDLWRLTGTVWTEITANGSWPAARQAHGIVHNSQTESWCSLGEPAMPMTPC